jgi:predicted Zn-dependent protease
MTGRRRFNCIPLSQEVKLGEQNYRDVLRQYQGRVLPQNHPYTIMVNKVMQRLIPQAQLEGADWKIHVIKDDKMLNAFVLPG